MKQGLLFAHIEHSDKQSCLVATLGVLRDTLPSFGVSPVLVGQMPRSYRGAVAHVNEELLPEEIHDICTTCEKRFFIGSETVCPLCKGNRYKGCTSVPMASFRLFPIAPRVSKMYASKVRWFIDLIYTFSYTHQRLTSGAVKPCSTLMDSSSSATRRN